MTLRWIDVFLVVALGAAATGVVSWSTSSSAPPRARRTAGSVVVETMTPEYAPCEVEPAGDARPAGIRFALGANERLVGITSARVYPIDGPRVRVEGFCDVVSAQVEGGLDLQKWLDLRNPSGPHALLFGLSVEGPAGREARAGWARFDASDLRYANVLVRPHEGRAVRVIVKTASGQGVPGALVAIAPPVHMNGLVDVLLTTGPDGTCVVRGLDAKPWMATLPRSVGPEATQPRAAIGSRDTEATLVTPLRGTWTFVESEVEFPLRGGSLLVTAVGGAAGGGAGPGAWPVSSLVAPGAGPVRRWTWMLPSASRPGPLAVDVTFRGYGPLRIGDVRTPCRLRATAQQLAVVPRGEK